MHRASTLTLIAWTAACGGSRSALPGLSPAADPFPPPTVGAHGEFSGAALGWTLGSEAHVFVADDPFTELVYRRLVRPHVPDDSATDLRSALGNREVLAVGADRIEATEREQGRHDATIVFPGGALETPLLSVRLHAPGSCTGTAAVTELVYGFPYQTRLLAPPPHTTVVALFERPPLGAVTQTTAGLHGTAVRRLVTLVAQAAESLTARRDRVPRARPLVQLLAANPDLEADAGEVVPLLGRRGRPLYAVAFRARFAGRGGDTVLVSGVATTDTTLTRLNWVMTPVRAKLVGGLLQGSGDAGETPQARYVLRGTIGLTGAVGDLLLIDQFDDVVPRNSRSKVVDAGARRVLVAEPLALRCRSG